MSKPAGVQIRRWFSFLVGLLLVVNVCALTGWLFVAHAIRTVVEEAEPLALSASTLQRELLAAHSELFQYLGDFTPSPDKSLAHLDAVVAVLGQLRENPLSRGIALELDEMQLGTAQYRNVVEALLHTVPGSRGRLRIRACKAAAGNLEGLAEKVVQAARREISQRSRSTERAAVAALWACVLASLASVVGIFALRHWWKRFQDQILGM